MQRTIVAFLIHILAFLQVGYVYAYAPDQVPVVSDTVKKPAKDSVRSINLDPSNKN